MRLFLVSLDRSHRASRKQGSPTLFFPARGLPRRLGWSIGTLFGRPWTGQRPVEFPGPAQVSGVLLPLWFSAFSQVSGGSNFSGPHICLVFCFVYCCPYFRRIGACLRCFSVYSGEVRGEIVFPVARVSFACRCRVARFSACSVVPNSGTPRGYPQVPIPR